MPLGNLLPEGALARSEQRVLAGVPAQEMRCMGVLGVCFTARPYFMQKQRAGCIDGPVKVVCQAAFFFS